MKVKNRLEFSELQIDPPNQNSKAPRRRLRWTNRPADHSEPLIIGGADLDSQTTKPLAMWGPTALSPQYAATALLG
jgi:hypothetical protein